MITKLLIITLVDDSVIKRDITFMKIPNLPIGAPANHEAYLQICTIVACQGTNDDNHTGPKELTYIPPSQIKKVKIEFEEPKLQKV